MFAINLKKQLFYYYEENQTKSVFPICLWNHSNKHRPNDVISGYLSLDIVYEHFTNFSNGKYAFRWI